MKRNLWTDSGGRNGVLTFFGRRGAEHGSQHIISDPRRVLRKDGSFVFRSHAAFRCWVCSHKKQSQQKHTPFIPSNQSVNMFINKLSQSLPSSRTHHEESWSSFHCKHGSPNTKRRTRSTSSKSLAERYSLLIRVVDHIYRRPDVEKRMEGKFDRTASPNRYSF